MKKIRAIAIAGFISIILPFLGLPLVIKKIVFVIMGAVLLGVAYLIFRESEIRNRARLEEELDEKEPEFEENL
jgi:threonine/homoserine/homoserine lactone efflux protein